MKINWYCKLLKHFVIKYINFIIFHFYKGIKIISLYWLIAIAEFLITIKFYKDLLKNLPGTPQNFTFPKFLQNKCYCIMLLWDFHASRIMYQWIVNKHALLMCVINVGTCIICIALVNGINSKKNVKSMNLQPSSFPFFVSQTHFLWGSLFELESMTQFMC